jgi:repressor LexA
MNAYHLIGMLTERQEGVLNFIRSYQIAQSVPPSTRNIARKFGLSQPTVTGHLRSLARKNRIDKLADGKWGFRAPLSEQRSSFEFTIYGSIPAGIPSIQEQEVEGTVFIDPSVFGVRSKAIWFLRVCGDSMANAGILDGDLVVLERKEPHPGDIVAALLDGNENTLKRFIKENGRTYLRSENPRFRDITPITGLDCQGVVVGLIRPKV